ncbi:tagaturonate reductase [uncultured Algibacter sp.]|uniref:tagaturonate reductase n=1 Tax=uncultured Algibacter sp. TaxID=298659 RepID=UPI0026381462|nr:tagaturonate reductase [uncultured Algibacter sp.]
MKKLNRTNYNVNTKLPIKVLQFGEGNFLRAFVNYAVQELNDTQNFNAGVAVVQPIEHGMVNMLNNQDGLYTLFLKGVEKGEEIQEKQVITNIVKGINPYKNFQDYINLAKEDTLEFVISNTTEAGISYIETDTLNMEPPSSFPAKLTVFLYKRFKHFKGNSSKGLTIIPCELINYNADTLKEIILKYCKLWNLEADFSKWIINHNSFHNTLVDRIVPGYPKDDIESYNKQLDYQDNLIVSAETFFLWVIEGDETLSKKLPFNKTKLQVKIVEDMQPYRSRKVRILNGAHTALVPFSMLYGNTTVKESIDNNFTGSFIKDTVFKEIIETLDLDKNELEAFAEDVFDRFRNPFVKHLLASIALNTVSKFKVRVLPSLLGYVEKFNKLPVNLTFSLACLIRFYKGDWKDNSLPINDAENVVAFFNDVWKDPDYHSIAQNVLSNTDFWGSDLNQIVNLTDGITHALKEIDTNGIEKGYDNFRKSFQS